MVTRGEILTAARRKARQLVKEAMRERNIKPSFVDAKAITAAANEVLAECPELIAEAEKELSTR